MRRLPRPKQLLALTATVVFALAAASLAVRVHRFRAAHDAVVHLGGRVEFDGPAWLRSVAGERPLPYFDDVHTLDLNWQPITDDDLVRLVAHLEQFPDLHSLKLAGARITDAGMPAFARLDQPLRYLDLSGTQIGDAGAEHLRHMGTLDSLDLSGTNITDAAVPHLRHLARLERLNLDNTAVSDAGIVSLKPLDRLEQLDVSNTGVTELGRSELVEALPEMEVFDD